MAAALQLPAGPAGEESIMKQWQCQICGYVYDPVKGDVENGILPGTPFEALPGEWVCPVCGVGKDMFEEI